MKTLLALIALSAFLSACDFPGDGFPIGPGAPCPGKGCPKGGN